MTALERITIGGIVPVVRIERADDAARLARTLAGANLPCIEITFRSAAAVDAIRAISMATLAEVEALMAGAGARVRG